MKQKQILIILFLNLIICSSNSAQNWDINLLKQINPQKPTNHVLIGASNSVYPLAVGTPMIIVGVGLLSKNKITTDKGIKIATSLLVNTAITQATKYTIKRERPYKTYPNALNVNTIESDASFPSGHTSTAFALATSIFIEFNNKWYIAVPVYAWAATVGYSRMYLGVHYPSDVIAGAFVGVGSVYLNKWLQKKIFKQK